MLCRKVGEWAWKAVNSVFDCLPLAAVIGGKMLCLHGGISSRLRSLTQLDRIPRPLKLDQHKPGLLTDILWSDPFDGISGTALCICISASHCLWLCPLLPGLPSSLQIVAEGTTALVRLRGSNQSFDSQNHDHMVGTPYPAGDQDRPAF